MKAAVEHHFTGTTEPLTGTYDSTKTMIASLLRQSTGAGVEDNFISTKPAAIASIPDLVSSTPHQMPHVVKWSDNIYWVFLATAANAATSRFIAMFQFNSSTSTLTYKGFITTPGVTVAGSKLIRSIRALL